MEEIKQGGKMQSWGCKGCFCNGENGDQHFFFFAKILELLGGVTNQLWGWRGVKRGGAVAGQGGDWLGGEGGKWALPLRPLLDPVFPGGDPAPPQRVLPPPLSPSSSSSSRPATAPPWRSGGEPRAAGEGAWALTARGDRRRRRRAPGGEEAPAAASGSAPRSLAAAGEKVGRVRHDGMQAAAHARYRRNGGDGPETGGGGRARGRARQPQCGLARLLPRSLSLALFNPFPRPALRKDLVC